MKNVPHVFQYGASESNGQSVGSDEHPPQPAETGDLVPPQRSANQAERTTVDPRGTGQLTPARQARLVILALTIILLGTGAGLASALTLPKTYGARAELLYPISRDQRGGDPLRQDRQLSTQLVYLKSRAVLGPIAQQQGMQFQDLDRDVSVEVLQNSEVIQVQAQGATKESARQTLQAVVDGYIALAAQPTGVTRSLDTQLTEARANTTQLQTRVQQLTTAVVAGTATQVALNEARSQLTESVDREKAIQVRIDEIKLTGQTGTGAQLLTPPYVLPDPVSPQPLVATGTGALVGLIVAGGVVAVAARRRARS